MCEHEFKSSSIPSKKFRPDSHKGYRHSKEEYKSHKGDESNETLMLNSKDTKQKPVAAVEKPMSDDELKTYFNEYISVAKEQRQQQIISSDAKLHEIIFKLYQSLQYKVEQPEGK